MYSLNKEIDLPEASEYSEFGLPYADYPVDADPTDCCLSDNWHCRELSNLDNCKKFMSSRCAESWDDKCDLYLNKKSSDKVEMYKFLKDVISKKYCRLADNSNCSIKCEPYNPMNQTSAMVCDYFGSETLIDPTKSLDIGYYTKVNLSPDYVGRCNLTCDKINKITPNDKVINTCLSLGICNEELDNICKVSNDTNVNINNPALNAYCSIKYPKPIKQQISNNPQLSVDNKNNDYNKNNDSNKLYLLILLLVIAIILFYFVSKKQK